MVHGTLPIIISIPKTASFFDLNKKKKYAIRPGMESQALYPHLNAAAIFGASEVTFLKSNQPNFTFNPGQNYTENPNEQQQNNGLGFQFNQGPSIFQTGMIEEMEVFKIDYKGIKKAPNQNQIAQAFGGTSTMFAGTGSNFGFGSNSAFGLGTGGLGTGFNLQE